MSQQRHYKTLKTFNFQGLKIEIVESDERVTNCLVCLKVLHGPNATIIESCKHSFCSKCLLKGIIEFQDDEFTCPNKLQVCQQKMSKEEIQQFMGPENYHLYLISRVDKKVNALIANVLDYPLEVNQSKFEPLETKFTASGSDDDGEKPELGKSQVRTNGSAVQQEFKGSIPYFPGQWSPVNLSGKKFYVREQILQLRDQPASRAPVCLSDYVAGMLLKENRDFLIKTLGESTAETFRSFDPLLPDHNNMSRTNEKTDGSFCQKLEIIEPKLIPTRTQSNQINCFLPQSSTEPQIHRAIEISPHSFLTVNQVQPRQIEVPATSTSFPQIAINKQVSGKATVQQNFNISEQEQILSEFGFKRCWLCCFLILKENEIELRNCSHKFCKTCMRKHIEEESTRGSEVPVCPFPSFISACDSFIDVYDSLTIFSRQDLSRLSFRGYQMLDTN